ncbi:hypothetical protein CDAR_219291 [Caerostris darwini]|uniref:Uncharacterized protein n=1 Tax=Caerostris darwini TaxID=1538125 RepID=A0AAV4PMU2_9ARAC|nr:hypothetical protein CDAR_219291 [Caerostris darwini]
MKSSPTNKMQKIESLSRLTLEGVLRRSMPAWASTFPPFSTVECPVPIENGMVAKWICIPIGEAKYEFHLISRNLDGNSAVQSSGADFQEISTGSGPMKSSPTNEMLKIETLSGLAHRRGVQTINACGLRHPPPFFTVECPVSIENGMGRNGEKI